MIGALADAHYKDCLNLVERYQIKTVTRAYAMLEESDRNYMHSRTEGDLSDETQIYRCLEESNARMADMAKEETYTLLDKVLFVSSMKMKNAFSRSDH